MRLSHEKIEFIKKNRHDQSPKAIARALGGEVSVRQVEKVLRALGDLDAVRRAWRRRVAAVLTGLVLLGGAGYWAKRVYDAREAERAKEEARLRELEARKTERRIYDVLDKHEKGHDAEVAKEVGHSDDAVRLAAVRYFLIDGSPASAELVLKRTGDSSQRVRLATLQLASDSPSPAADETLAAVAASKEQGLPERTLALAALRRRTPAQIRSVAPRLLDVLAEGQEILRRNAHEVLARAFPESRIAFGPDGPALRAAWQSVVRGAP